MSRLFPRRSGLVTWLAGLALLLMWAPRAGAVRVADVPNPQVTRGGWVIDVAGVLSLPVIDSLDAISRRLAEDQGAQLAFAIVPETSGEDPKAFASALFQRWSVGRASADDGILVLLVTEARRIEVETGYGVEGVLPDARVGRILDRSVVPHFRNGDWGAGLIAGAEEFSSAIRSGESMAADAAAPASGRSRAFQVVGRILGLMATLAGVAAWFRWLRFCPKCRRPMRLLGEIEDDAYISLLDRLEETLRSVDHRVWRCDPCGIFTVEQRRALFTSFDDCPNCFRRTRSVERVTLRPATKTHEGLAQVDRRCRNAACGHHESVREPIARIVESSGSSGGSSSGSSSGGSFGGGSSGGGGAGRSF